MNYSNLSKEQINLLNANTTEINRLVCRTASNMIEIGLLLNQIKNCLPDRTWISWIEENLPFSQRTARYYMRAADMFPSLIGCENLPISITVMKQITSPEISAIAGLVINELIANQTSPDRVVKAVEAIQQIKVGNNITINGEHALNGLNVVITEIDGPIISVIHDGEEFALMPSEVGLSVFTEKKSSMPKKTSKNLELKSHNDLLSEELSLLKTKVRKLISLLSSNQDPSELIKELSNV